MKQVKKNLHTDIRGKGVYGSFSGLCYLSCCCYALFGGMIIAIFASLYATRQSIPCHVFPKTALLSSFNPSTTQRLHFNKSWWTNARQEKKRWTEIAASITLVNWRRRDDNTIHRWPVDTGRCCGRNIAVHKAVGTCHANNEIKERIRY